MMCRRTPDGSSIENVGGPCSGTPTSGTARAGTIRDVVVGAAALLAALIFAVHAPAIAEQETHNFHAGESFRDCPDCPEMVVLPAGSFAMGSSPADTIQDRRSLRDEEVGTARSFMEREQPQHSLTIRKPFALGKYLVTRREFAAFVRDAAYSISGDCIDWANHYFKRPPGAGWPNPGFSQTEREPAVCVNWQDAQAYVAWLNSKLHDPMATKPYRLASEAEWEYAARAGTQTARWWGDSIGLDNADCDGCGSRWDARKTAPVGSFRPNLFGLYDMLGNVWEWTEDCWHESYTGAPDNGSPWLTGSCKQRVIRGGGWVSRPWLLRSATRTCPDSSTRANYIGFRVARTLPKRNFNAGQELQDAPARGGRASERGVR